MSEDPDDRPPALRRILQHTGAPPCWGHYDPSHCANIGHILERCPFYPSCKKRTDRSHEHKYERGLIDKSTTRDMIAGKKVKKEEDPDYEKVQEELARLKRRRLEHLEQKGDEHGS